MTFIPTVNSVTSTANSSSGSLGDGSTFTGTSEDVSQYKTINLNISSTLNSANSGVIIEYSIDNSNWEFKQVFTYETDKKFNKSLSPLSKYFRIKYTNISGSGSATLRLQAIFSVNLEPKNDTKLVNFTNELKDSLGRLRISEAKTLFESSNVLGTINTLQNTSLTTGTGAVALITNTPIIDVSIAGAPSSPRSLIQSRQRGVYQQGKSLLIHVSGILNPGGANDANFVGRIGYFDDDNGVFFQIDSQGLSIIVRSNISGSVDDSRKIQQSDWNVDTLDGNGTSGITLNMEKINTFIIDLEWLGSGEIRAGILKDNQVIYGHIFTNSSALPYMYCATLPVRFEATNNGLNSSGSIQSVAYSVMSEGGYNPTGRIYSFGRKGLNKIHKSNRFYPLISMKLDTTGLHSKVQVNLRGFSLLVTSVGNVQIYALLYRDTTDTAIFSNPLFL